MLYRISKWKMNGQDPQSSKKRLNSLSTFRNYGKRSAAVVKAVPIVGQREVAFRHFTEIKTMERKKSILGNRPKTQDKNAFLEFLSVPINKSTVVVELKCKSTGVAASRKCPSPSESLVGSSGSGVFDMPILTKEMENRHQEPSAKTPSNGYQPVT